MIAKTDAIVIGKHAFSNTSRMITWLTRDYGRVTTSIKGACRPKSFFLGQIDLAYTCELLFYQRERDGVHIAREVFPLSCRAPLRDNWRAAVAAEYLSHLTAQTTGPFLESERLFLDLSDALDALTSGVNPIAVTLIYELRLLRDLGFAPSFAPCPDCAAKESRKRDCRFLIASGHLGCAYARSAELSEESVSLSPRLLAAISCAASLAEKESFASAAAKVAESANENILVGMRRFLGIFVAHHLEISPYSRRTAFAYLEINANAKCRDTL